MPHQIDEIIDIITQVDQARVANFSYTQTAFDGDDIAGVSSFSPAAEQNIPDTASTDLDANVLNKGMRAQGASIPRNGLNHFFGRTSFNINKLVQNMLLFVALVKLKFNKSAGLYEADMPYTTGDIVFIVSGSGPTTTIMYYVCTVASTTGVTPGTDPNRWVPVSLDLRYNKSLLAGKAFIPSYTSVDLTTGGFLTDTWYPVTSGQVPLITPATGAGQVRILFEAYGEYGGGKAHLATQTTVAGLAGFDTDVVEVDLSVNNLGAPITPSPIGYSHLTLGRQRVIWLRGGARYLLFNTGGLEFTVRTTSYNNGVDSAIVPVTSRTFTPVLRRVHLRAAVPTTVVADEAVNLAQMQAADTVVNTAVTTTVNTAVTTHANLTNPHSATSDATADRLMLRDANGRAKVAAPSASDDIARLDTVEKFGTTNVIKRLVARYATDSWTGRVIGDSGVTGWETITWSPELGIFCAVWNTTATVFRASISPDGINWTYISLSGLSSSTKWRKVCWSPELGIFVVVGDNSTSVFTSPDGINWTARTIPEGNQWRGITWSPELGIFVAVGVSGTNRIMTSPDGINWTMRSGQNNNFWLDVTWSSELGLFVAVGNILMAPGGTENIMTSPDGINWTARTAPENTFWRETTWSPELGIFCAVSVSSTPTYRIMTSPDGINWTGVTSLMGQAQSITWSPELGIFLAVTNTGSIPMAISEDGFNWGAVTSISALDFQNVVWSPELGIFAVVLGAGGSAGTPKLYYSRNLLG